jgi:hypothetical protein
LSSRHPRSKGYDTENRMRKDHHMADSQSKCAHKRTRLIAKDDDSQYLECLDCGEILEGDEIKEEPAKSGFDESLSDA